MSWEAARRAALKRDEHRCVRCRLAAEQVHHRKLKQMGKTSDETLLFGLDNLVSLCAKCHGWIHAHPAESYEQGWMVHSWLQPEEVPLPIRSDDLLF